MATYYPGLSYQRDNLPTQYLGDQKSGSFIGSPSHHDNSTLYINQAPTGAFSEILSGNVQIPSVGDRNEMAFIPPTSETLSLQSVDGQLNIARSNPICSPVALDPQVVPRTQANIVNVEQSFQSQGLSLSLGTQMQSTVPVSSFQYQYQGYLPLFSNYHPFSGKENIARNCEESKRSKELRNSESMPSNFSRGNNNTFETGDLSYPMCSISHKGMHSDAYQYESSFENTILNSKYLKAAQELLDEVVSVRKALKQPDSDKHQSSQAKPSNGMSSEPSESITNSSEPSPAERQELQTKKTKLLAMLDDVDRRCKQYYHQMKIVMSSFDMVAGHGAAKPYTALALQTISRHFRCLRDAISGQIQATQRTLGEQDTSSNSQGGIIPRLRYVDHQLRQQRALQQLGVMRNAWRPQRGLPESSVSILRAWLFEHFLHPYPKDSEKVMLAKQTGLTRNQVANWFINARVRLWKPMIEEMYKEEFGRMEANSKFSLENASKTLRENSSASEDREEDLQEGMTSKASDADSVQSGQIQHLKSDSAPEVELNRPIARSVFHNSTQGGTGSDAGVMRLQADQRPNMDGNNLYSDSIISSSQNGNGALLPGDAMYDLTELSGFSVGGQVSLALGLRHHENDIFPMSDEANMARNNKISTSMGPPDAVDFHCVEPGNQQDRFANPHILHDFVV